MGGRRGERWLRLGDGKPFVKDVFSFVGFRSIWLKSLRLFTGVMIGRIPLLLQTSAPFSLCFRIVVDFRAGEY